MSTYGMYSHISILINNEHPISPQKPTNRINKFAKIATVIIILALIRCISEVFRLNYYSDTDITFKEIQPFLVGALITSIALLKMVLFSFWSKPKPIIFLSILASILLLVAKKVYMMS